MRNAGAALTNEEQFSNPKWTVKLMDNAWDVPSRTYHNIPLEYNTHGATQLPAGRVNYFPELPLHFETPAAYAAWVNTNVPSGKYYTSVVAGDYHPAYGTGVNWAIGSTFVVHAVGLRGAVVTQQMLQGNRPWDRVVFDFFRDIRNKLHFTDDFVNAVQEWAKGNVMLLHKEGTFSTHCSLHSRNATAARCGYVDDDGVYQTYFGPGYTQDIDGATDSLVKDSDLYKYRISNFPYVQKTAENETITGAQGVVIPASALFATTMGTTKSRALADEFLRHIAKTEEQYKAVAVHKFPGSREALQKAIDENAFETPSDTTELFMLQGVTASIGNLDMVVTQAQADAYHEAMKSFLIEFYAAHLANDTDAIETAITTAVAAFQTASGVTSAQAAENYGTLIK